jgi:hypothetical protein
VESIPGWNEMIASATFEEKKPLKPRSPITRA